MKLIIKYCYICKKLFEYDASREPSRKVCPTCTPILEKRIKREWALKNRKLLNERLRNEYKLNPQRFKEASKRYRTKPEVKKKLQEYQNKYYMEQRDKHNAIIRKWRKTENGRKYRERHLKRRKGFIPVMPNIFEDCIVDHHHIHKTAPLIIPIPRNIHLSVGGNHNGHFEKNNEFIEKMYLIDTNLFLEGELPEDTARY
jgi:hypothetical protein